MKTYPVIVPYSKNPSFVTRLEPLSDIKKRFGLGQQEESFQPRRRVSLYGLSGVGYGSLSLSLSSSLSFSYGRQRLTYLRKTQIAIAYAYWLQKMYQDTSVFWVHASNADRFRQSYASIAKKCNIRGHDDPKADILLLVCSWLKLQNKMQWLMIVDNADDVDLFFPNQLRKGSPGEDGHKTTPTTTTPTNSGLARYIPDCDHGSVLITTRDKKVGVRLYQGLPPIKIDKMTDSEAYQLVQVIISN